MNYYTQSFLKVTVRTYHLFLSPRLRAITLINSYLNGSKSKIFNDTIMKITHAYQVGKQL